MVKGTITTRMPTPVHNFFAAFVADTITRQLRIISDSSGPSSEFAAQVFNGGSARIYLKEADADEHGRCTKAPHRREPDANFSIETLNTQAWYSKSPIRKMEKI
ncbi:hypothetical protein V494_08191 [Pseudogymnoascus sp. VKM F-4513 (FW-928)]|nr:hypothetical protein V494_08191 [Pseudogymnoascus sp. VKM F-4513 (FW-928)]